MMQVQGENRNSDIEKGSEVSPQLTSDEDQLQVSSSRPQQSREAQHWDTLPSSTSQNRICSRTTLYVGNLAPQIAKAHLQKLFQAYGEVKRVHLVQTAGNQGVRGREEWNACSTIGQQKDAFVVGYSKGYGFVEFDTSRSANLAMNCIHGRMLLGRSLVVRPARDNDKAKGHSGTAPSSSMTLSSHQYIDNSHAIRREKAGLESKIALVKRALEEKQQNSISRVQKHARGDAAR